MNHYHTPYTKINSKWIKHLHIGSETIELLEENTGGKFPDMGLGYDFLDLTPKAKTTETKISETTSN